MELGDFIFRPILKLCSTRTGSKPGISLYDQAKTSRGAFLDGMKEMPTYHSWSWSGKERSSMERRCAGSGKIFDFKNFVLRWIWFQAFSLLYRISLSIYQWRLNLGFGNDWWNSFFLEVTEFFIYLFIDGISFRYDGIYIAVKSFFFYCLLSSDSLRILHSLGSAVSFKSWTRIDR